jgi:hypothetical protein
MEDELMNDIIDCIDIPIVVRETVDVEDKYIITQAILTLIRKRERKFLENVLVALDKYYVDCYEDGSYPCDPSSNQIIDAIRQDIRQLNARNTEC